MATTGQITWSPSFNSLTFAESAYIALDDTDYFDFGTSDFRIAMLFWPDSTITNPANNKDLLSKYDGSLASDTGWYTTYNPTSGLVGLGINDGDVAQTSVSEAGNITNDTWNFVVWEVDRSGSCYIYVNGIEVYSASVSNASGSVNKATSLTFSRSNGFKGRLGYLSIESGTSVIYGSTYALEEYYKIKYGWPRRHVNGGATWNFADSLDDESGVYTWDHSAAASYYGAGYPSSHTLTFNYLYDYEQGFLPLDNIIRTLDGTAKVYQGPSKRRLFLSFISTSLEQNIALEGAWVSKSPMYVWLDNTKAYDIYGYIIEPPSIKEIAYGIYQYECEFEEL